MALMETPLCDFGWKAVDFLLPSVDGKTYALQDICGEKGTLIMFICNHCPYVQRVIDGLVQDCKTLQDEGVGVVAVMANDTVNYPEDNFESMKLFAEKHAFSFPYLLDKTQKTARAYDAICTPDFFGFNADMELHYRGHADELLESMRRIAETGQGPKAQKPSMGCSIKWMG